MTATVTPYQPWGLPVGNRVMAWMGRVRGQELFDLDPVQMAKRGVHRAGWGDVDDLGAGVDEAVGVLCDAARSEGRLTPFGRFMLEVQISIHVENWLKAKRFLAEHPDTAGRPVTSPIVVVGMARTGTTILQALLAADPAHRAVEHWEAAHPVPPPTVEGYATDRRRRRARMEQFGANWLSPELKSIHPVVVENEPEECVVLLGNVLQDYHFWLAQRTPAYYRWMLDHDLRPAFEAHKAQLQVLSHHRTEGTFVLKSPGHLFALDALLAVYPDARIVFTHRHPHEAVGSACSLAAALHHMASDRVDIAELGLTMCDRFAEGLELAEAVRRSHPTASFVDVDYRELVADPLGTIGSVYESWGTPLTPEASLAMQVWMAEHPGGRFGRHRYRLADFGLRPDQVSERFAPYIEAHALDEPTRHESLRIDSADG